MISPFQNIPVEGDTLLPERNMVNMSEVLPKGDGLQNIPAPNVSSLFHGTFEGLGFGSQFKATQYGHIASFLYIDNGSMIVSHKGVKFRLYNRGGIYRSLFRFNMKKIDVCILKECQFAASHGRRCINHITKRSVERNHEDFLELMFAPYIEKTQVVISPMFAIYPSSST